MEKTKRIRWGAACCAILMLAGFLCISGAYLHYSCQLYKWPFVYNTVLFDPNRTYISMLPKNYIVIPTVVLPADNNMINFIFRGKEVGPEIQKRLEPWTTAKVFPFESLKEYLSSSCLVWGRMPRDRENEALAGFAASNLKAIKIGEKEYTIVGQLRSEASIVNNCYLAGSTRDEIYSEDNKAMCMAFTILPQLNRNDIKTIEKHSDGSEVYRGAIAYLHMPMLAPADFCWYITGLCFLLAGGSGLFIYLYGIAAVKLKGSWLGRPLEEIVSHWKLLIGIHVLLFGLLILCQITGYVYPKLQIVLNEAINIQRAQSAIDRIGYIAYYYRSVPAAAVMTFVNNFICSLFITLPSLLLPGSGILYQIGSSVLFISGSPVFSPNAGRMIWHSFVYLMEMEGYILAVFFGMLVPIYLFEKRRGRLWKRYWQAILINAQGLVLVAIILGASAVYEAIEVLKAWGKY